MNPRQVESRQFGIANRRLTYRRGNYTEAEVTSWRAILVGVVQISAADSFLHCGERGASRRTGRRAREFCVGRSSPPGLPLLLAP